jgi:hypothetical protein
VSAKESAQGSARKPDMVYPRRVRVGVAAAIMLSTWGAVQYFRLESDYRQKSRDLYQLVTQADRLNDARAVIPEDAVLGYVTDLEAGSVLASSIFSITQYALAPRLLEPDTNETLALGNFSQPLNYAAAGRQHGLRVERDFQNGIILYRKESAK